jgi:hypothetical protein
MTNGRMMHALTLAVLAAFIPAVVLGAKVSVEEVRGVAAQVADRALEAALARDIAIKAVENAIAAQDASESDLMAAMAAGDAGRIKRSRRALAEALEATGEAVALAVTVVDCAVRAGSAAAEADALLAGLDGAGEEALESAAARMADLLRVAERASRKASRLVEKLKTRWLTPPVRSPAATTTLQAPDDPPTPTPVGRR